MVFVQLGSDPGFHPAGAFPVMRSISLQRQQKEGRISCWVFLCVFLFPIGCSAELLGVFSSTSPYLNPCVTLSMSTVRSTLIFSRKRVHGRMRNTTHVRNEVLRTAAYASFQLFFSLLHVSLKYVLGNENLNKHILSASSQLLSSSASWLPKRSCAQPTLCWILN